MQETAMKKGDEKMRTGNMILFVVTLTALFHVSDVVTCSAVDYLRLDHEIFVYDGVSPVRLTNDFYTDNMPRMNNSGQVVWQKDDGEDWEIFFFDGVTTVQITDNAYEDENPRINKDGELVWEGDPGPGWEIFFYDGATTVQITDNDYDDRSPAMNNNGEVVWEGQDGTWGEAEILLYNGVDTIPLTDDTNRDEDPQINDSGYVVWESENGDDDILLYDGTSISNLSDALGSGTFVNPRIGNNGHVIWEDLDDEVVYLYDGVSVHLLTQAGEESDSPRIADNGNAVWKNYEHMGAGFEIHFYDGTGATAVGSSNWDLEPAEISRNGTHAVWEDFDGVNYYNGITTVQVVPGHHQMRSEMGVNNSGHMVWMERVCMDGDGDGYGDPGHNFHCTYTETDCDDSNPDVNPGATEGPLGDPTCSDTLDNDCDDLTDAEEPSCDPCVDVDGDGYGSSGFLNCTYPEPDCDDNNPDVNPGAAEILGNGLDDDCNPETPDVVLFHDRVDPLVAGLKVVASGDLDDDGFDDLVVGEYGESPVGVKVLMSNGDGTFQAPVTLWLYESGIPYFTFFDIAIGDLDGDGNPDVLASGGATWYGPSVYGVIVVAMGNGDGTFEEGVILTPPGVVYYLPYGMVTMDLDHDDDLDLCVSFSTAWGSYVQVFLNNGDGTFVEGEVYLAGGYIFHSMASADLNGDTHPDLAVVDTVADQVLVLLGVGDGTFLGEVSYAAGDHPVSVAAADLNGDDHPDLAVANAYGDDVSVLIGDGDGTLEAAVNYAVGNNPLWIVLEDFDGDNQPEIAVVNEADDNFSVLMGNGDGTFGNEGRYATLASPQCLAAGDLNGDTHPDMSVAALGGLSVFLNSQGDPPATTWGAASTVHAGSGPASNVLNTVLMLVIPAGAVLLWRRRRR